MNALAAQSVERPESQSVEMLAAAVRLVNGGEGQAAVAEPPAAAAPAAEAKDTTPARPGEPMPAAAGEPQPPIEATAPAAHPQASAPLLRSAFGETGTLSEAYAAISSGLFTLGGLAVRMARSLRAGSARW
jgi:hypothetical protein